eukprot:Hpha_TRINITY_DN14513_c0_g3::TRINITY_DN14513_c0_g3_i1::g.46891::m.46891
MKGCVWLRVLVVVVLVGAGAASSSSGDDGLPFCQACDSRRCPVRQYGAPYLTWLETNCPVEYIDDYTVECILLANDDGLPGHGGHGDHGGGHGEPPYTILVIFGSFAMGASLRFLLLGTQVPYTVVLFLIGMAFGGASLYDGFSLQNYAAISEIDPHLIFYIFLPALIFESAFAMDIPIFLKVVGQCILMAVPGLMVASLITGSVAKFVFAKYDWNWYACLLFGTILSATDPVAVVALLKELGASPIISTLIEGESLFNDGTAIVFFNVLVDAIKKQSCEPIGCILDFDKASVVPQSDHHVRYASWPAGTDPHCLCVHVECEMPLGYLEIVLEFFRVSFGGLGVGLVFGAVTVWSLNQVFNDALIEVTLTLVAAYVTFFVCEGILTVSGVLGVVACGCLMSHYNTCISPDVEHTLHHFWEMLTYLANTLIFLLAGLIVSLKAFGEVGSVDFGYMLITYATINVARTAVLILFMPILRLFRYKLDVGNSVLVAWGGLRGAVGLALALIIQADDNVAIETVRTKVIFHVSGIVLLTLCVNGVTTSKVVKAFKLDEISLRRRKQMRARWLDLQAEKELDLGDLVAEPLYYDTNWEELDTAVNLSSAIPNGNEDPYNEKGWAAREGLDDDDETVDRKQREEGRSAYIATCNASFHKQYAQGQLTPLGCRELHHFAVAAREKGDRAQTEWEKDYNTREDQIDQQQGAGNRKSMYGVLPPSQAPLVLMDASVIRPLFDMTYFRTRIVKLVSGEVGSQQLAFDIALGFIRCHETIQHVIHDLCEPHIANKILTHSKRAVKETCLVLEEASLKRPDVSTSIKTKQAARAILNSMQSDLNTMHHEGRLDDQDRAVLHRIVDLSIRNLKYMPRSLAHPTNEEILENCPWYTAAERQCQKMIFVSTLEQYAVQDFEGGAMLYNGDNRSPTLPGLMLIVYGIAEIRVGRNRFRFASGTTLGWPQVLTGATRLGNVWTVSRCRCLVFPEKTVRMLIKRHPEFSKAAWRDCGIQTARVLLGLEVGSSHRFDEKRWTQRRIRKMAERGIVEVLQDKDGYDETHERRHTLAPNCHYVMLRGSAWEYGEAADHFDKPSKFKFPTLIPSDFKFATFTGHAVLFTMEEELTAAERARQRWGRLRSKCRSIFLWSALRNKRCGQCALAWALGRTPPPIPEPDPRLEQKYRLEAEKACLEEEERMAAEAAVTDTMSQQRGGNRVHGLVEHVDFSGVADAPVLAPVTQRPLRRQSVVANLEKQQKRPQTTRNNPGDTSLVDRSGAGAFKKLLYPAIPRLNVDVPESPRRSISPPRRPSKAAPPPAEDTSPVVKMRVVAADGEFDVGQFKADLAKAKGVEIDPSAVEVLGTESVEGPLPPQTDVRLRFRGLGPKGEKLARDLAEHTGKLPEGSLDGLQPTSVSIEEPPTTKSESQGGSPASPMPPTGPAPAAIPAGVPPPADLTSILRDLELIEQGTPLARFSESPPRAKQTAPKATFSDLLSDPEAGGLDDPDLNIDELFQQPATLQRKLSL